MSGYVRKADMAAARLALNIAPGCHDPAEILIASFHADLMGGMKKLNTPAIRARYDELARELRLRYDAAKKWGYIHPNKRAES